MKVFKFKIYCSGKSYMIGKLCSEVALRATSREAALKYIGYMVDGLIQNSSLFYVIEEDGVIMKLLTVQEAKELNEEMKDN